MKENYFYIDEAGSLESNSNFFILGCYKTDTPDEVRSSINSLKEEIINSPYFAYERTEFLKQGFHACENHFDIRARFYNLIAMLNIRAYILLLNKKSEFYKELVLANTSSLEIYNMCINKLLCDRLIKTRNDNNNLIFEQYGNKINKWQSNIDSIIQNVKKTVDEKFGVNLSYNVEVHDKADQNLSVIDYINFIFIQFFENNKIEKRMKENFNIIEPKIALIYKFDKDAFYDNNKKINIERY